MSDEPCTDCGDTGITYQTERRCACQPEPTRPQPSAEPVADWLQECTDGRVSSHTITMLNAFRRWYDEYRVNPALEAARREALEQAGNTGWRIGARVKVADHVPDAELWNRDEWFIVGIRQERGRPGLNISISTDFPMTLRSDGATDDFYVERPDQSDDLLALKENTNG